MYLTEDAARRACRKVTQTDSRFKNQILYVVWESPRYELATELDLDTYYAGIRDNDIIAAYRNGEDVS